MKFAFSVDMSEDLVSDISQYMIKRISSMRPEKLEDIAPTKPDSENTKELSIKLEQILDLIEQHVGTEIREELDLLDSLVWGSQIEAAYLNGVRDGMRLWSFLIRWVAPSDFVIT